MRKMRNYLLSLLCVTVVLTSCEVDESLNIDQKNPSEVPAGGLFTNALKNLGDQMNSCSVNENVFRLYAQYWAQTTYPDESQYNQVTRNIGGNIWSTMYRDVLKDLKGAKELVSNGEAPSQAQLAIIKFMEVYAYSVLVDTFGDVPFTEALDPLNPSPVYDDAATIYSALASHLDEAIADLSSGAGFDASQDIAYGGNVAQWRQAAVSLKLRMAMRLADSNPSASQAMAESAFSAGPIVANTDNFGINYLASAPNTNPLWVSLVQSGRKDFVAANTLVDAMNPNNDPRLPTFFQMYDGAYVGGTYGNANGASSNSDLSELIKMPDFKGDLITAAEVHFLLSEAAARGYSVGGTAEAYYNSAIGVSMDEWGVSTSDAATYLALPEVAYATADGDWMQKIGSQKWVAMFNNGNEGWTTWRLFDLGLNGPEVDGVTLDIPTRFLYPVSEATLNGSQYDNAASAIGGDSKTTKIFWDVY
jgi:hypothetical protein